MIFVANYASCEDANCMRDDSKNVDAEQLAWPAVVGLYSDLATAKACALEAFVEENSDMFELTEKEMMDDDGAPKWCCRTGRSRTYRATTARDPTPAPSATTATSSACASSERWR